MEFLPGRHGVTGELQVHRIVCHVIGRVWFMSEQHNRFICRDTFQCHFQLGLSAKKVIHTAEPKSLPVTFRGTERLRKTEI